MRGRGGKTGTMASRFCPPPPPLVNLGFGSHVLAGCRLESSSSSATFFLVGERGGGDAPSEPVPLL